MRNKIKNVLPGEEFGSLSCQASTIREKVPYKRQLKTLFEFKQ